MVGIIAGLFHFPPNDLLDFNDEELFFWYDRAIKFNKAQNKGSK